MTRAAVTAALVLAALPASAAGDHELLAAQQELRIARDHLEAAGPDYQGHRRAAMDLIDQASQELRRALDVSSGSQREGKPARRSHAAEPTEQPGD